VSQPAPQAARQEAMRRLIDGVVADVADYFILEQLLCEQFDAALRHQHARLAELATHIGALCDTLEARRQKRVGHVEHLLAPGARMSAVFPLMKGAARASLETHWLALETRVAECRRLGKRNSDLLVDQFGLMQRVLHGEEMLYAPA
jgi:flagella synthesis protein FlgN